MSIDTKHDDLQSLRIDRSHRDDSGGQPPKWSTRYILIGIGVVVLLGLVALAYRIFAPATPELEVVRAVAEGGGDTGGVVLSASGYIVAHHKINVNSKVTGRVKWIGVEKGDKVKEGQVLVRLEDDEFRAQYQQALGAVENAKAYLLQLQNGSRPEEIQQAQHNLDEARATAANDKVTLDRTQELLRRASFRSRRSTTPPPSTKPISSVRIPWSKASALEARAACRGDRPGQGRGCSRRKARRLTRSRSWMRPMFARRSAARFWNATRKRAS